jgi:hypothetical protein
MASYGIAFTIILQIYYVGRVPRNTFSWDDFLYLQVTILQFTTEIYIPIIPADVFRHICNFFPSYVVRTQNPKQMCLYMIIISKFSYVGNYSKK